MARKRNHTPPAKKSSHRARFSYLPEILIIFGIGMVTVSTVHNIVRFRALSIDKKIVAEYHAAPAVAPLPVPTHIFIKWFVDVDIEKEVYTDNHWTISPDKASYLAQSARPSTDGNMIIYGHNLRTVLGNIRALKGNETIVLTLSDGTTRSYKIVSMQQVDPANTKLLSPTNTETLTLYTCAGFLDSQRFVVVAKPL